MGLSNGAFPTLIVAGVFLVVGLLIAIYPSLPWTKTDDLPYKRVGDMGVGLVTGALITMGFYMAGNVVAGQQERQNFFSMISSSPDLRGLDASAYKDDFHGIWLTSKTLDGANFSGANLSQASLRDATLRGAELENADVRGANLVGVDLFGADLATADLRGAKLEGANMEEAIMPAARMLKGARVNARTCFPLFFFQKVQEGLVSLVPDNKDSAAPDRYGHVCTGSDHDQKI